ncbi:MAG: porin family protein, partial [Mesorhizobium sp.]
MSPQAKIVLTAGALAVCLLGPATAADLSPAY